MTARSKAAFFLILMLSVAAGPFSMQVFLPALPDIQKSFQVSQATAQLTLSLSMVSIAIFTLLYGPLSDRFGRKPVLVGGMVLFLGGSLLSTFAPSIGALVVGRIIQAAGSGSGMVLGRAMVRDAYGANEAPKLIHYLTMAMVTAPMIAPVIGGFLTDGFGWRSNFAVTAVLAALIVSMVILMLRETLPSSKRSHSAEGALRQSALGGLRIVSRSRAFWGYALVSSFNMAVFFAFVSGAPYLMSEGLNRPASEYGLWFLGVPGMYVAGSFLAARLLGTIGLDRSIVWGAVLCAVFLAIGAVLYWALPLTPALLFVPTYFISFFQGLVISNGVAGAINTTPSAVGAASGLVGFVQMMISAVAAQIAGIFVTDCIWSLIIIMTICTGITLALLPMIRGAESTRTGAQTPSSGGP